MRRYFQNTHSEAFLLPDEYPLNSQKKYNRITSSPQYIYKLLYSIRFETIVYKISHVVISFPKTLQSKIEDALTLSFSWRGNSTFNNYLNRFLNILEAIIIYRLDHLKKKSNRSIPQTLNNQY